MFVRVLGSAAGGGFPQWNCNCANCRGVREGKPGLSARTQSSIAVSKDGIDWALFNTSPDILTQLKQNPCLQPARGLRDTGIRGIILVDAQIDHTTGLLMLREGSRPLPIWCTDQVHEDLTKGNPLFNVLSHYCTVDWHRIVPSETERFTIPGVDGLDFLCVALKSAAPPYSPHRNNPHPGDNIGVVIRDIATGKSLFYSPGLVEIEPHLVPLMESADAVMVDGTFWTDTEMIDMGISKKRAREIGHNPQSGHGGMIEELNRFTKPRRILIHINNTNPILNEHSPERAELTRHGIEVSYDGMEITL